MSPRVRTSRTDVGALSLWLWSRIAVALAAGAGAVALGTDRGPVDLWRRWDADLLRKIAEHGYAGRPEHYPDRGVEAFFPGFPLVLRAVHAVVPDWTAAGLLVSLVAGTVAAVALARLAALDGGPDVGRRAVLLLVTAPSAVFLFAGYTEALFLAVAVPAWLSARDGRWAAAGLLAAAACTVRVNGAFLAAALVVQYLVAHRGRLRRDVLWLAAPAVALLGYAAYLRWLTGDWLRWFGAQEEGWGRRPTAPWDALAATLDMASGWGHFAYVARLEVAAVAAGVAVTAVLLARRRWAEAVYVGLSVGALMTSTFWFSVARSSLLWFPLWVLLAGATVRRPWLLHAWFAVCAPLMVLGVLLFTSGRWAG